MNTNFGSKTSWDECLSINEDINDYMACIDPNLHGPAHMAVAGTWHRSSSQKDTSDCAQWFSVLKTPIPSCSNTNDNECNSDHISYVNIQPYAASCFQCPTCNLKLSSDNCMCELKDHCNSQFEDINRLTHNIMTSKENIQILGDFADSVCAVNDIVFLFHHCNLDRHFQHWLERQQSLKNTNYLNFPSNGYDGTRLDDIISSSDPFIGIFDVSKLSRSKREKLISRNGQLTHRDVLDITTISKIDYSYDSILQLQQPRQQSETTRHVRGLSENKKISNDMSNSTNLLQIQVHNIRGFKSQSSSRILSSYNHMHYDGYMGFGTILYICIMLFILFLGIPYLIYFFCVKCFYPRNDGTIVTTNTNICTTETICQNEHDDNNISKQDDNNNNTSS